MIDLIKGRDNYMDNLTKSQRHKNMKNIKSKDTKIEVMLCKALWHKGYRYRKNYKELPGKPDIVLTKYKIAIFCDGEFFHGRNWREQRKRVAKGNNSEYWLRKISRNIDRDAEVERQLFQMGWTVLRFWGKDIKKNLDECVKAVEDTIYELEVENAEASYDETIDEYIKEFNIDKEK